MTRLVAAVVSLAAALGVVPRVAAVADEPLRGGVAAPVHRAEERLRRDLSGVLALRATPDSTCLFVRADGESVFESKPDVGLVPASLMKVVTSAAALEVIAPNEVYKTEVFVRADALAAVEDGVLQGDVYLVGGGDPVLSTPGYIRRYPEPVAHTDITKLGDRVFAALADQGITRIEGRLVGDDSWFSDQERDYTSHYPAIAGTKPPAPVWKRSFVTLNTVGQLSGLLLNDGYSSYSWSVASSGRRRNVRAQNPAQHAASVFDEVLEARGMVITRRPASGTAPLPKERASLGSIESPPLSEILIRVLSRSDNTTAEMLLKEIGRRTAGSARSTAVASVQQIMEQRLGPLAEGLVIVDGSGLSNQNRVTCAAVVELLSQAGPGSPLVEGLAVAGERGVLRSCRPAVSGQDQHNAIRAKTGTLNESTGLAGVTVAANGEVLTFAMMANRPSIIVLGNCNSIRRGVMNAVARYTYRDLAPSSAVHSGDREALEALFDATGGHGWFNSYGWGTDWPLARWHGVSTNASGRVTEVVLSGPFGNGLAGALPDEIADLSELARLDLSGNDLSNSLPAGITSLSELRELRITGTSLCLSESLQSSTAWFESISEPLVTECTSFDDTLGHPHADALEDLASRGVLEGTECTATRMCPDEPVDRATLAVWLLRILGHTEPEALNTSRFADLDPGSWQIAYVERFAELGFTSGCARNPLRFCPEANLKRGHMAAFLTRALNLQAEEPVEFPDTIDSVFRRDIAAVAQAGIMSPCEGTPTHFCPRDAVTRGQAATILVAAQGFHAAS